MIQEQSLLKEMTAERFGARCMLICFCAYEGSARGVMDIK